MKPCSKTRSDKSACANIFLEPTLTINAGIILEWIHHHVIGHTLTFIHWLLMIIYLQFWRSRRSGIQKQPPEVFLKILQIWQESTCVGVFFFYKVASLQTCNVIKKRLLHRCFPAEFEKFWRRPISKNIWTTASEYWLLHILIFTIHYSARFSFLQITSSLLRN